MKTENMGNLSDALKQAVQILSDDKSSDPHLDRAYDLIDAAIDAVNAAHSR